jgi:hypothetical protein
VTPDPVRVEALRLHARLLEEARRLGARHVIAYLETHEKEFVAAYATTRGEQGHAGPVSPFLYTLT